MKFSLKILLLGASFLVPMVAQAWVKSISVEKKFVGENIQVLEVSVKCNIDKTERKLRKVTSKKSDWCSVDLPELCSQRKVKAARQMCQYSRDEYRQLVAKQKSGADAKTVSVDNSNAARIDAPKVDSREELLEEKIIIEEQRIKIAEMQLELKRKELALRNQLVDQN